MLDLDLLAVPRLSSGIEPRLTADGALYLLRDSGDDDLLIDDDGAWVAALLRLCDGRRGVGDVRALLARDGHDDDERRVGEALAALAGAGIVHDAAQDATVLPDAVSERFDRQLAYFRDLIAPNEAASAQARLSAATVCVIGVGGLGSWCAWALSSSGIGALVLVDGDDVELSNLNRQVLYRPADVGRPKVEAAAEVLRAFAPAMRVVPVRARLEDLDATRRAVAGADLVVNAADWPPHRIDRWVDQACREARIAHLAMSQQPPLIRVGPLYVPGRTGCHACEEHAWREEFPDYDLVAEAVQPFAPAATFGPACGAVGALAASEAVHFLAQTAHPRSLGCAILLDTATYAVTYRPVERVAGCCGAARAM